MYIYISPFKSFELYKSFHIYTLILSPSFFAFVPFACVQWFCNSSIRCICKRKSQSMFRWIFIYIAQYEYLLYLVHS